MEGVMIWKCVDLDKMSNEGVLVGSTMPARSLRPQRLVPGVRGASQPMPRSPVSRLLSQAVTEERNTTSAVVCACHRAAAFRFTVTAGLTLQYGRSILVPSRHKGAGCVEIS